MQLSSHPATTSMIAAIHTLRRHAGLADDDTYRDFLQRTAGVRSAKDLSAASAPRVIEKLRELAGGAGAAKGTVTGLDGAIGSKLRALWISGYNLGVIRDRSDQAMLSFLQKQTGVSHVRFLKDARSGTSAIEGLKSWLARKGHVEWPDSEDVLRSKRAVLEAQWRRLAELGDAKHDTGTATTIMTDLFAYAMRVARKNRWEAFESHDYDEVQQALGRRLRGALARQAQAAAGNAGDVA